MKLDCLPKDFVRRRFVLEIFAIRSEMADGLTLFRDQLYFSATKQRRTKSFGTHDHNTSNNTSTKLQLQRIKLHIEIINLKPVTPTTILLRWSSKLVGTLPEMVQTIVPKDFTQYCSSPPLCTMISYGYTLSLGRIFCLIESTLDTMNPK